MTYLITGCFGFVGKHLAAHLLANDPNARIAAIGRAKIPDDFPPVAACYAMDMLDYQDLSEILVKERPNFIVHLASVSSVAFSWQNPIASFTNNTNIFLNLLECVRQHAPDARVLSIGSSEEYGIVNASNLPLNESTPLRPVSPYAVARVAQEHLGDVYVRGYGLDIVTTRSFNHVGAGQSDKFVLSSIAKQFAEIAHGKRTALALGSTSVVRDFLDVRDVVRAYSAIMNHGERGEVYNVCSGHGISIAEVIELYRKVSGLTPVTSTDSALLRPVENPVVIGCNRKLVDALGWAPSHRLEESLQWIYQYWLENI